MNITTKKTFLFPGQGVQYVGMGKEIYENSPLAKRLYDLANEILGFDLAGICFKGKQELLDMSSICQPAILVTSLAIMEAFRDQGKNDTICYAAAGLSLGEYTALVFAGAIGFEDAIRLVHNRGKYMEEACDKNPGGMITIIGLDERTIEDICNNSRWAGEISPANYNYPGQIVLSGEKKALEIASSLAKESGARIVLPLNVNGAFHSILMSPASHKLEKELDKIKINRPRIPIIANIDGRYISEPDDIRSSLVKQLTSPVLWCHSILNLIRDGVEEFNGVGPGRVMVSILKKIDKRKKIKSIDTLESFRYN